MMKLLVHTDVSALEEERGLDLCQVGEQAWVSFKVIVSAHS